MMLKDLVELSIFAMCAKLLISLCPGKNYEKYLKFLVNILILARFLVPLTLLFGGAGMPAEEELRRFEEKMEECLENVRESAEEAMGPEQEAWIDEGFGGVENRPGEGPIGQISGIQPVSVRIGGEDCEEGEGSAQGDTGK